MKLPLIPVKRLSADNQHHVVAGFRPVWTTVHRSRAGLNALKSGHGAAKGPPPQASRGASESYSLLDDSGAGCPGLVAELARSFRAIEGSWTAFYANHR